MIDLNALERRVTPDPFAFPHRHRAEANINWGKSILPYAFAYH